MSNDHVGIPRFIENGFATSGIVYSYDTILDRIRRSPTSKLGTEADYYEKDVEKDLLSNNVENDFAKYYSPIIDSQDIDYILCETESNKELIYRFFSFMYYRSKESLKYINSNSISSAILGDLNHSELLRIQNVININPLKLFGEQCDVVPIINNSGQNFIDNSIGVGAMAYKDGGIVFFMPLNYRIGLMFCHEDYYEGNRYLLIEATNKAFAERLNEAIVQYEVGYGNGFIFGKHKEDLKKSIDIIKELKSRKIY